MGSATGEIKKKSVKLTQSRETTRSNSGVTKENQMVYDHTFLWIC